MIMVPAIEAPLADGIVLLRQSMERDIPEILIAYQDDPRLHLRLGEDRPPTGAQLGSRQERADVERAQGIAVTLSVCEDGADTCIGQVQAINFDWAQRRAELHLWLSPGARGRGHGRRALELASQWLLGTVGLKRLELMIGAENGTVLATARAAGFAAAGPRRGSAPEPRQRPGTVILVRVAEGPER